MEKKYNFVYVTTNLINGKQYVGDHSCDTIDKYMGSGKLIKYAINHYGKNNFSREILEFFNNKDDAFSAQSKYIISYNTIVPNGYNISSKGGLCVVGCLQHSEETKKKMSISQKNAYTNERKEKVILSNKNRKVSEKMLQNLTFKGHKHSDESKEKMSISRMGLLAGDKHPMYGKHHSDEAKQKIGNASKNRSPETLEKMSKASKGKPKSEETKERMRLGWIIRRQNNNLPD